MAQEHDTINSDVFLSVVIPAHNEEYRLAPSLARLTELLAGQPWRWEILVVENGSADRTYEVACEAARSSPNIRALREECRGKGLAVRRGMIEARGRYRFLCDVDHSMPAEQILRFLPPQLEVFDLAIATREAAQSVVVEPWWRRLVGRVFNRLVRMLVLGGFRDTQCGFKCFTAHATSLLFARQRLDGLTFDVELLFIARKLGLQVVEVPITWHYNPDSRVRMLSDSFRMLRDLLKIRQNSARGLYE